MAQGSTEQAASVEELSVTIAGIAAKAENNAQNAGKAAALANSIMGSAQTGSEQMDRMTTAVAEITEANRAIDKVIEMIDTIAFKTNILAINAAVEAAHAGEYGKGFAIVAEEVRSLASQSSAAAKDTGILVKNSIEKAELGVYIADETAASLSQIVSGIKESGKLVNDIAGFSEEQRVAITQINMAIEQVALIVHRNGKTAEESARSSETMNLQAEVLQELMSEFKLRDRRIVADTNDGDEG